MNKPEAILSDADGTLVDTMHLIRHGQYETAKGYLTHRGIPADEIPGFDDYQVLLNKSIGGSARDTLEKTVRLLYQEQPHHIDGIDFDALHDMLNPVQDTIAPEFVRGYDGLADFLNTLGTQAIKLAIFTSGTPHHIVRNFGIALPELGLGELYLDASRSDIDKLQEFEQSVTNYFGIPDFTVVTCDDTATHKPDPEGLEIAMQRLGIKPNVAMVLGDHTVDMQAGVNAGIPERVGITHGFEGRAILEAAGATRTVDSLARLAEQFTV